jgi:hypothetical protein
VFKTVFVDRHFSPNGFLRSALATCVSITVTIAAFHEWVRATLTDFNHGMYPGSLLFCEIVTVLLVNVGIDYASLAKTRYLLFLSQRSHKISLHIVTFLVDLFLSFSLVKLIGILTSRTLLIVGEALQPGLGGMKGPFEVIGTALIISVFVGLCGVLIGRLFFLLWIISSFIVRTRSRLESTLGWLKVALDVDDRPLQSVGLVAGCLVALGYWICAVFGSVSWQSFGFNGILELIFPFIGFNIV